MEVMGSKPVIAADLFKALSDETRLRIVNLLERRRTLSVSELVRALRLPQWHVSRHLTRLRRAGLVSSEKKGTWVYYSLAEDLREMVRRVVTAVRARFDGGAMAADLQRLRAILRRRGPIGEQ